MVNYYGPCRVIDFNGTPYYVVDPDFGTSLQVYPDVPGVHYIVDAQTFVGNMAALTAYVDADQSNLQHVFMGDTPTVHPNTVALTFVDQTQADAVIGSLV